MTKQYPIISLNEELYLIDKEQRPVDRTPCIGYHKDTGIPMLDEHYYEEDERLYVYSCSRILASTHTKLNDRLGLPLLPAVEDSTMLLAREAAVMNNYDVDNDTFKHGFVVGHRAASTKKWSDEDVEKIFWAGVNKGQDGILNQIKGSKIKIVELEEFLQSLQPKPKFVWIEVENDVPLIENGYVKINKWED